MVYWFIIYYVSIVEIMIFIKAMKSLALAICTLPLGGCAVAVGLIFASLLRSESYAPDMSGTLFTRAMLGFGLVETFALFVLVLAGVSIVI